MSTWKTYKLSEIINLIGGGTPKTTESAYWGGSIPWLSVVDFNDDYRYVYSTEKTITERGLAESSTKLLKKGQLIISARGTVGQLAQLGKDMAFNQSCYGIDAKPQTTNNFLYYLIKLKVGELQAKAHGGIFDTITRHTFEQIEVSIPPLEKQQEIVDVLDALDARIALNQRMNQNLEQLAQALFK